MIEDEEKKGCKDNLGGWVGNGKSVMRGEGRESGVVGEELGR